MISITDSLVPSFAARLGESMAQWKRDGLNSAMLRVPISHAALATEAAKFGFVFHHAEGDSAVLKCWLNGQKPDKLPPFASHRMRAHTLWQYMCRPRACALPAFAALRLTLCPSAPRARTTIARRA